MNVGAGVPARVLVLVGVGVAIWVAPGIAAPAARSGHTTADEPQYLMTALSLGEDRDLDVADERAEQRYRAFHRADLPRQEEVQRGGRAVSPHDPLLPALLAVPMGVGGWVGAKVALASVAGALAAALVWVAVVRFGVTTRVAVVVVSAFSASAPLAVYGTQVYPELVAALACTGAIAALTGPLGGRGRVLLGACVVALPWLSVKYAPVAAALAASGLVALWRRRELRALTVFVGVLAVAAGAFAVAHLAWYGGLTPYAAGSHFVEGELTVMGDPDYVGRSVRLAGLLLDRDFGLAAWQPAYLLVVPAFASLAGARAQHRGVLVLPFALGWLSATFVALTMHGWWFPGRQVVVVLPCAVLAVAWWASTRAAVARAVAVCGALGASVYAWLVAQAVLGDLTTVVTFESLAHPLWRAWRLVLPDYRDLTARDWALHAGWIAALAAVALRTGVTSRRGPLRTGVTSGAVAPATDAGSTRALVRGGGRPW